MISLYTRQTQAPVKPLVNSYWVRPGVLLAGEYPLTGNDADSAVRLQDLLLAGVTCFINLTAVDELTAYEGRLPARFGGKPVVHRRFAIRDHGVPEQAQQMAAILDAIDEALAAGMGVYVHCRAGIGRTGTVIGCHLVRHGYDGSQALEILNSLWQECGRASRWPHVPETDEQEAFILKFQNQQSIVTGSLAMAHGRADTYQGALLGLALGDALGTAIASSKNAGASGAAEGIIHNLSGLRWGGETAMSLALADSLLHCAQMHAEDQMQRYLAWQKQGRYSSDGHVMAVPSLVQKALGLWQWKRNPLAGSHDPALMDAHSLARCTPVALYFAGNPVMALREAAESSRTTSQAPIVLDACRVFAALLLGIVEGVPPAQWLQFNTGKALTALRELRLKPELERLIDGGWRTAMSQPAGEDIVSVLATAIHALATTPDFQSAVFKAMHKAARPASVAAVCGALAGARYGVQGLPIVWRETLPGANELLTVAERLLTAASSD